MLEFVGYIASALIGLSLGLIGGGGSILTVPILVYLFQVNPVVATSYSLFVVGSTSFIGAYSKYKAGLVDVKTAIVFGIPSIITIFITRKFFVPALPDYFGSIANLQITKAIFLLLLFSVLMIAASISMIRSGSNKEEVIDSTPKFNYPIIILDGVAVGVLTGFVGAGGGFLIIPALIFLCGLQMKKAIGTSLMIITFNSIFGFIGDFGQYEHNWKLLITITLIAIIGILIGNKLSKTIDGSKLKKGFGWFVLAVGIYIMINEIYFTN